MTKKENLIECFKVGIDYYQKYMGILIGLPNNKQEVTIFERNCFSDKLKYYSDNYNDELQLIRNNEIHIKDFCCASSFEEIELDILT